MKELLPVLASPRSESISFNLDPWDFAKVSLTCPDCHTQCQAAGRVRNSWYTLCKCGTYIQICSSIDDYSD